MNDGSIRVGTKLDLSGLKADIKKLEKELQAAQKEADKLSAKEQKVKEQFSAEREIDAEVDKKYSHGSEIDKQEAEALAQVKAQQEELNQKIQEYNAMLEQANAKLQQQLAIAQASKELDGAVKSEAILDKVTTQEQYNSLLEQTEAKMASIEDRARQIADANGVSYEELLKANPTYQKLSDTMGVLTSTTRAFKSEADDAGNTAKKSFNKAKKESNALNSSIKSGIKTIGRMALAVLGIRGAYSLVRRAVNACLQSNEELNNKMTAIWNALGTLMEPVVTAMINAIYKILAYINYFVKALTGIDFIAKANAKAIAKQAAATDKLTKSTREANKALAAFDEMSVLQDNGTVQTGIETAPTLDLPELSEEEMETLDMIAGIFRTVYEEIEKVIINSNLLKTKWEELDETTQILIITLGVAGLVGILTGSVGVAVAILAVVLAIAGLNLLINGDTKDALDGFILLLGAAGLVGILIGGTTGWTVAGSIIAVGLIILGFNYLLNGDTTDAILGIIALLGGAGLAGYLWFGVKGLSVAIAFASLMLLVMGFNDLMDGDTTNSIEGIIKALVGSVGLVVAIDALIDILTGGKGLEGALIGLKSPFGYLLAATAILVGSIVELCKNWGSMSGLEKTISIFKVLAAAAMVAACAIATFHTAWSIGTAAVAILGGLAVLGLTLAQNSISDNELEESGKAMATDFYNSHDFGSNPLPQLAVGGIVNNPGRGVHAIIGEAGAEAVLPLENNTEWMDILAEKIGGNVTIPIYMDGKKIATYVVDIQKKRAFAMNGA